MKKRLLAIALILCLTAGLFPARAHAAETGFEEPKVSAFTAEIGGEVHSLLAGGSLNLELAGGTVPHADFKVTFENPSRVGDVYIVSEANGKKTHLEAAKASTGVYTLSSSDLEFLSGEISVVFSKAALCTSQKDALEFMENMKLAGLANLVKTKENEDGTNSTTFELCKAAGETADVVFDAFIEEAPFLDEAGGALDAWLDGINVVESLTSYVVQTEDGRYRLYFGEPSDLNAGQGLVLVKDLTNGGFTKLVIKELPDNQSMATLADYISTAGYVSKLVVNYNSITEDMDTLREEIESSNMPEAQKAAALDQAKDLERDRTFFLAATTILPLLATAAGGPAGTVFSVLLTAMTASSEYFWQYRVGLIKGSTPATLFHSEHAGRVPLGAPRPSDVGGYYSFSDSSESGDYLPGYYYIADESHMPFYIPQNTSVTVCAHGSNRGFNLLSGATLDIEDCKFVEHADGTIEGGKLGLGMNTDSKLIVDNIHISGIAGTSTCTSADITIDGGIVDHFTEDCSGCHFNITVNGGSLGYITTSTAHETSGTITINGGTVGKGGSAILGSNDNSGLAKQDIVINGGVLTGSVCSNGNFTMNGGTINGKMIKKQVADTFEINGGTINGRISNSALAPLRITDGTITEDIYAAGAAGPVTILVIKPSSDITVAKGIVCYDKESVVVEAASGYTGGVTFYSSANDTVGEHMTLQEAQDRIRQKPKAYFRLKGDSDPVPACQHRYNTKTVAATCTQGGHVLHVCLRCGDTYRTNETPALGHDLAFSHWETLVKNNKTYDVRVQTCQRTGCIYADRKAYNTQNESDPVKEPVITSAKKQGLSLSDFKTAGKFLAPEVEIENIGELAETVKAYIALYSGDGQMLGTQMVELKTVDHGSQTYAMDPISFGSISKSAAASVKLFLLSGEEIPLHQVLTDGDGEG